MKTYSPSIFFRNGHVNTIYPTMLKWTVKYRTREKHETEGGDYYYMDWIRDKNRRLVILLHGLEGSSDSSYIRRITNLLTEHDWDVCGLNFRSCMGPISSSSTLYHSGFTQDLHDLITRVEDDYDEIFIVGYSLGGNAVMKYLGDQKYPLSDKIKAAMGISVPCDLAGCSKVLSKGFNRLYDRNFLNSLMSKMKDKNELTIDKTRYLERPTIKYLIDFDDYFTGPLHDFKDAADYYAQSNCLQFLHQIDRPTLMINSLDDPLLSKDCYPYEAAKKNDNFTLETTQYGGHVGFADFGKDTYWIEYKILEFVLRISQL